MADPLPDPPIVKGNWQTVRTGHKLINLVNNRVLDWEPASGDYRIWNYDQNATQSDPLPAPAVVSGNWKTVRTGHELVYISALGALLDWEPATGHWRLWDYDPNATNSDPFPGPAVAEAQASNGALSAGRQVIPISDKLLIWEPPSGYFMLLEYKSKLELFSGYATQGNWATVRAGHRLINLALNPGSNDKPRVLDWEPASGNYRIWPYDDEAIPKHSDPLPAPAVVSGNWKTVRTGHELVYLGSNRMLDWQPASGDYRIWNYDRT